MNRGAVAGALILASIVLCAATGFGVGALLGAAVLIGLIGVFVGVLVGFAVVYARFKDI